VGGAIFPIVPPADNYIATVFRMAVVAEIPALRFKFDLALTRDFRSVIGEILTKHIGVANLKPVFAGFDNNESKFARLIRG
jgi:hypothetical protein